MRRSVSTTTAAGYMVAWLMAGAMLVSGSAYADKGSGKTDAQSESVQAAHLFEEYYDILPQRDLRGVPLDPSMTDKQAAQYRVDSYNDTEKKLATLRQRLMKLDHATVGAMLRKQLETQIEDDTYRTMSVMEIVARSYPKEYEDYRKLIKPGVDDSGLADYVKETFLGKNGALHEDLKDVMP